jgi:hypothetical protein
MLLHINPTRQRGKRTGSLARASGWYMTFFAAGVISGLALEVSAVEDFDGIHAYDRTKSTNIRGSIATTGPIPLRKAMSLCSNARGQSMGCWHHDFALSVVAE